MTSRHSITNRSWAKRAVAGIVLVLCAALVAFLCGAWFTAAFIAEPQGFAGAADVLLAGIIAALLAGLLSVFLALRLSLRTLVLYTFGALALAILSVAILIVRLQSLDNRRDISNHNPQCYPCPVDVTERISSAGNAKTRGGCQMIPPISQITGPAFTAKGTWPKALCHPILQQFASSGLAITIKVR